MAASANLERFVDEFIARSAMRNYYPQAFHRMRRRYGTKDAVALTVEQGEGKSGFYRLQALGLEDWSVESAVMNFPEEFSRHTVNCAADRLCWRELAA